METLEALKGRRSCRSFKPDMVPDDILNKIIEAGTYAANGKGAQAGLIIAVTNKELRDELMVQNRSYFPNASDDYDPFYGAPVILIVLANTEVFTHVEDGSLIMGNLMNAAYDLGVDSIWIHRAQQEFDSDWGKELLKKLGIEGSYRGVGHCALGYAAAPLKEAAPRKENFVVWVR